MRAFLTGLIDYAGLFPPATLPLEQAVAEYAEHCRSDEAWMLSRFICPSAKLAALEALLDDADTAGPMRISMLGRGGDDLASLQKAVAEDQRNLQDFREKAGDRAIVDVVEMRVPSDTDAVALLGDFAESNALRPFGEVTAGIDDVAARQTMIAQMAKGGGVGGVGFKLRCGGIEASAFPSTCTIVDLIGACRDANVAMKFTAGLHHPVRHFNSSVNTKMHGFLNVFGACIFDHVKPMDRDAMDALLNEEDAAAFVFEGDEMRWHDQRATTTQIDDARHGFAISYGSCSFDEPRDDLVALGLL